MPKTERDRGYYRYYHYKKALRHKKITEQVYYKGIEYPYFKFFNQYDGAIHCSCGMCSRWTKTNNSTHRRRRIHGNYAPSYNPSMRDRKRLEAMAASELDYYSSLD